MGVPCPSCKREYDVTLFEFGRTLWCTCGSRVGAEIRMRPLGTLVEKRFIADAMLGRLARWLRLLGFDCAYDADIEDADLVRRGVEEERIVLSRDAALSEEWRMPWIHRVRSEVLEEQLRDVIDRFQLAGSVRLLSRCSECNGSLEPVAASQVAGRVPPRILATQPTFRECRSCGRVYWEGSHAARIRRVADRVLSREEAAPES